jgi:hypothetical protein
MSVKPNVCLGVSFMCVRLDAHDVAAAIKSFAKGCHVIVGNAMDVRKWRPCCSTPILNICSSYRVGSQDATLA